MAVTESVRDSRARRVAAPDPEGVTFGDRLRRARAERSLTLQDLVSFTGSGTPSYFSKIENGQIHEPSAAMLVRLARLFKWSMDDLYEWFVSPEERAVEQKIEAVEAELNDDPDAQGIMSGSALFQNDLKGKKQYLDFLLAYRDRRQR